MNGRDNLSVTQKYGIINEDRLQNIVTIYIYLYVHDFVRVTRVLNVMLNVSL